MIIICWENITVVIWIDPSKNIAISAILKIFPCNSKDLPRKKSKPSIDNNTNKPELLLMKKVNRYFWRSYQITKNNASWSNLYFQLNKRYLLCWLRIDSLGLAQLRHTQKIKKILTDQELIISCKKHHKTIKNIINKEHICIQAMSNLIVETGKSTLS